MCERTTFSSVNGLVELEICKVPAWSQPDKTARLPPKCARTPNSSTTFYRIPVGCNVPIHAGPALHVMPDRVGAGKAGTPGWEDTSSTRGPSCSFSNREPSMVGKTSWRKPC